MTLDHSTSYYFQLEIITHRLYFIIKVSPQSGKTQLSSVEVPD